MKSINQYIADDMEYNIQQIKKLAEEIPFWNELGIAHLNCDYTNFYGSSASVKFDSIETLAEAIKIVLSKAEGQITKGFSEYDGNVNAKFDYKERVITFNSPTGAQCKVERVEEERDVPARKEKVTWYKLIGDCKPLLES